MGNLRVKLGTVNMFGKRMVNRREPAVPEAKFEGMLGEWRERVQVEDERVTTTLLREGERALRDETSGNQAASASGAPATRNSFAQDSEVAPSAAKSPRALGHAATES